MLNFLGLSFQSACEIVGTFLAIYFSGLAIYRLFFHPLSKFPGPRFAAVTDIYWALGWWSGIWPHQLKTLHDQYGTVVRIAPNELSFSSPTSWQDIYGHAKGAHKPFRKSDFYDQVRPDGESHLAMIRDFEKHRALKKTLSHAFSLQALRDQEYVVHKYVDLLIEKIKERANEGKALDIAAWLTWATFDITGDLSFGEAFGCVENTKTHFWIEAFEGSMTIATLFAIMKRIPLLKLSIPLIFILNPGFLSSFNAQQSFSLSQASARKQRPNDRDDFFSHILKSNSKAAKSNSDSNSNYNDGSEMKVEPTDAFLAAQADLLIIAGSDTTSTLLSALITLLLRNPTELETLKKEVRVAFGKKEEIRADDVAKLPFLNACLEEALRLNAPTASGLPRESPGAVVDGWFVPKGTTVSTSTLVTSRSPTSYHNPNSFIPSRHLSSSLSPSSPYAKDNHTASKPFGVGPTSCIGVNLAYMVMRIVLAKLIWSFDWEMAMKDGRKVVKGEEGMKEWVEWDRDAKFKTMTIKPEVWVRFVEVDGQV